LRRTVRHDLFEIRCDGAFEAVVRGCAEPRAERPRTWINDEIVRLYTSLFRLGFAHCVESWHGGELVGGLYGVALGGAFFGESMFSRVSDASKVALAHLVARLRLGQFRLLDTQFVTRHLRQFGAQEIPRALYRRQLAAALAADAHFPAGRFDGAAVLSLLQSSTPTS
jgi:leucyl/phenylalanyl-tRNA---protein transferase